MNEHVEKARDIFARHLAACMLADMTEICRTHYDLIQCGWRVVEPRERKRETDEAGRAAAVSQFLSILEAHEVKDYRLRDIHIAGLRAIGYDATPLSDDEAMRTMLIENAIARHMLATAQVQPDEVVATRDELEQLGWRVNEINPPARTPVEVLPLGEPYTSLVSLFLNALVWHECRVDRYRDDHLAEMRVRGWDVAWIGGGR